MDHLNPSQATKLAQDVYAFTKMSSYDMAMKFLKAEYGNNFTFCDQSVLKGKTGGPWMLKCRTAFGIVMIGKGAYKGHAYIIFRGTQYLADWLTNLNILISRSHTAQPVHDGFNTAFKSMQPLLMPYISAFGKENIHSVHCVGHSLGGALATLCGDWLKTNYKRATGIYTVGGPRVGLYDFSQSCSASVGKQNIFRLYHKTDIVPMIPPWPFVHTPLNGPDFYLPSPGIVPGAEYHDTQKYRESVQGRTWSSLANLREREKSDSQIEAWLKKSKPIAFGFEAMSWLNRAILYVLKKCMLGAAWLISKAAGTTLNLIDQLAIILKKGIDLSKSISGWVLMLIRKIMQLLGLGKVVELADLTRNFIRNIFTRLMQKANGVAKNALSQALVKGRAI